MAPVFERGAAKSYVKVLEPTSRQAVRTAEQIAPGMAETKPIAGSRKAFQTKLEAGKAEFGPKTAVAYEGAPAVSLTDAAESMQKIRERHIYLKGTRVVPRNRTALEQVLQGIESDLLDLADANGMIEQKLLDSLADDLNSGLVNARGELAAQAPKAKKFIEKRGAGAIKNILDSRNPTAQRVNAMYRIYAQAADMMEKARMARITAESAMKSGSSKGFGAAIKKALPGPVRRLPNAISGVFDSVLWNTVSGATKQSIAEALATGDFTKAARIMAGLAAIGVQSAESRPD